MTLLTRIHALCAVWAALHAPLHSPVQRFSSAHAIPHDSAATEMILEELRGYYRDLHDRNWTSIVTHFYPAKVTARFAVPDRDPVWIALDEPSVDAHEASDPRGYCLPSANVAVVGHWARVRARRCTGELDEAWFYSMGGRWKIIHLESGARLTTSQASRK
jgi:hypothetical protein